MARLSHLIRDNPCGQRKHCCRAPSTGVRFAAFEDSLLGMALDKTPTGGARRLTDPATGFAFTLRPYVVPLRDAPPLGARSKGALPHRALQTAFCLNLSRLPALRCVVRLC